ncbi:cytochrome c3 family protein [Geothermobacter hydrogeniphilus]|uniref:Uncharacterized protein n=1 Tax=Geothermobacter hydrogeniphilus TaxID=1969733 RepID=A0A1X0YBI0_9BACT|nr:cytochrome c3 family protein [Geothermobacter hydrogeniphilus]ORJ62476.1 hypothetical protein B5V00_04100 [Geothermobacter hydrogeniphilus]
MMKRFLSILFAISLLGALLYGCSSSSSDAPLLGTAHPDGWVLTHKADYRADPASCTGCHGGNYEGSGSAPACRSCHLGSAPNFSVHPDRWSANGAEPFVEHRHFHNDDKVSWTTCATAECHGATLKGGNGSGPTGPSCFSTSFTNDNAITNGCHPTGPPAPQSHAGGNFSDPANHGPEAKGANQNNNNQLVCRNCHGRPSNTFDGGMVADPNIINNPNGTCSQLACHPAAQAHPTEWQGSGSVPGIDPAYFSSHRTTDQVTRDEACVLCHRVSSGGPGPKPGAPSCFSSNFTNANGTANNCHANGPGVAPHPTDGSYRNPDGPTGHGPDAKANLSFCAGCHATNTAAGSNPRFNVQIGGLLNGCETCHKAGTAHPDSDRWTFNQDGQTRRTHFAAGNVTTACAMCHNVSVGDSGGAAPACTGCHLIQGVFTSLDCTSCHGTPPDGTADLTGSTTPVAHQTTKAGGGNFTDVTGVPQHETCAVCHGARDDGNGRLTVKNSNYALFDRNSATYNQGGDHLDGQIEMNGPAPNTGAAYDPGTVGCAKACHANDNAHQLPNVSGLTIANGDYGAGSGCTSCHQYPPDTSPVLGAPAIVPVTHLFSDNGVKLLANHDDCAVCHGTRDDGTGAHAPAVNYNPSVDHQNGSINININYGYSTTTGGCAQSCHGDNASHRFPVGGGSGNTIVEGDYGQSVAGCNACHGYPPDGNADSTPAAPVSHLFNDSGAALLANHNECQLCHGTKDDGNSAHLPTGDYNVSTDHSSGSININSQLQYVSNPADPTFGGCNNSCHGNDANHRFPNSSGLPITLGNYGGFTCASCHDNGANGAPIVKIGQNLHTSGNCEDCHPGGTRGTLHGAGTPVQPEVVFIPNNPTVGINYSSHGGIYLGGDATSQTTEAEICWGCHDSFNPKISEWGTNSTVNTGLVGYDYGQIYADAGTTTVTSNWVNAWWKSATPDFAYKTGQVSSTHSVNPAVTGPGVDNVAQIRCSYCHDVHDRNQAPGDNVSNAPYLRGTWKGNPYPEDGAPQSGHTYNIYNRYGPVPRGDISNNETGGYQIDQNNGRPNTWSADQFGGLCELCHANTGDPSLNGNGVWDPGEIDTLNEFGDPAQAWVGTNGHSAAVKGGGGTNAADILTAAIRNPSGIGNNKNDSGRPDMGYYSYNGSRGYGFRSLHSNGWQLLPSLDGSTENYAFKDYSWQDLNNNDINTDTGLDTSVHEFTCSKCHNPHASRLPRLMITNCLDTKHNTWDDDFQTIPNTSNGDGASTPSTENIGVTWSNSTSAQNCHRVKDPSFTNAGGDGWNRVTPWGAGGGSAPDNGTIP